MVRKVGSLEIARQEQARQHALSTYAYYYEYIRDYPQISVVLAYIRDEEVRFVRSQWHKRHYEEELLSTPYFMTRYGNCREVIEMIVKVDPEFDGEAAAKKFHVAMTTESDANKALFDAWRDELMKVNGKLARAKERYGRYLTPDDSNSHFVDGAITLP